MTGLKSPNLPLVVLESLACGTSVVTTRCGETPKLLAASCEVVALERTPDCIAEQKFALFPLICAVRGEVEQLKKQFFSNLKTVALILIPLVVLQTSLAQFYVPIVFGQKWVTAIPILVLICFSALPIALSRATSQLLHAVDKSHIDLYWNVIFTISLLLAVQRGIFEVAVVVLITQTIVMPIFTIWIKYHIFAKKSAL